MHDRRGHIAAVSEGAVVERDGCHGIAGLPVRVIAPVVAPGEPRKARALTRTPRAEACEVVERGRVPTHERAAPLVALEPLKGAADVLGLLRARGGRDVCYEHRPALARNRVAPLGDVRGRERHDLTRALVLREGAEEAWARGHAAVASCVRQLQVACKNLHRQRCPSRRQERNFHFFKVVFL